MKTKKNGFTLLELLLAMGLLAILAVLLIGNFNTTLKRGRDAQRKNDLSQLQKALELYYEDAKTYPSFDIGATSTKKFCSSQSCPSTDTVYMIKVPNDPNTQYTYNYVPVPTTGPATSYYLYSYLENTLDVGSGVSQTGYTTGAKCDTAKTTTNCRYYVGSSNAAILTPSP